MHQCIGTGYHSLLHFLGTDFIMADTPTNIEHSGLLVCSTCYLINVSVARCCFRCGPSGVLVLYDPQIPVQAEEKDGDVDLYCYEEDCCMSCSDSESDIGERPQEGAVTNNELTLTCLWCPPISMCKVCAHVWVDSVFT